MNGENILQVALVAALEHDRVTRLEGADDMFCINGPAREIDTVFVAHEDLYIVNNGPGPNAAEHESFDLRHVRRTGIAD